MAHKALHYGDGKGTRQDQKQLQKATYYKAQKELYDQLNQEYKTEQTHLQGIVKDKGVLGLIRGILKDFEGTLPVDYVFYSRAGASWLIPISISKARDLLVKEQNKFEDRIRVQETQVKKAVQKQIELRRRLKNLPDLEF